MPGAAIQSFHFNQNWPIAQTPEILLAEVSSLLPTLTVMSLMLSYRLASMLPVFDSSPTVQTLTVDDLMPKLEGEGIP